MKKILLSAVIAFGLSLSLSNNAFAHPGNTDAYGGHYCWTNCARWGYSYGEYHYHDNIDAETCFKWIPTAQQTEIKLDSLVNAFIDKQINGAGGIPGVGSIPGFSEMTLNQAEQMSKIYNDRLSIYYDSLDIIMDTTLKQIDRWNAMKIACAPYYEIDTNNNFISKIQPTKTNEQVCQESFGTNSFWDGTKTKDDLLNCNCKTGYTWNNARNACVLIPAKTNDQACADTYGSKSIWDGTKTNDGLLNCGCKTGYTWNNARNACVLIPKKTKAADFGKASILTSPDDLNKPALITNAETQKKGKVILVKWDKVSSVQYEYILSYIYYEKDEDLMKKEWKQLKGSSINLKITESRKGKKMYMYVRAVDKKSGIKSEIGFIDVQF